MKGTTMNFQDVQAFFKSWGMYPSEEDCTLDHLNPEVIEMGINRKVYEKVLKEAHTYAGFDLFVSTQVDATDDSFYLSAATWEELEDAWREWNLPD